jgi:hypothetical protein
MLRQVFVSIIYRCDASFNSLLTLLRPVSGTKTTHRLQPFPSANNAADCFLAVTPTTLPVSTVIHIRAGFAGAVPVS